VLIGALLLLGFVIEQHCPEGEHPRSARDALGEALRGVDLGAFDREIVEWLAAWDTPTVATVVSLLHRTRQAGRDERPRGSQFRSLRGH
jgi:hypothetical protein